MKTTQIVTGFAAVFHPAAAIISAVIEVGNNIYQTFKPNKTSAAADKDAEEQEQKGHNKAVIEAISLQGKEHSIRNHRKKSKMSSLPTVIK